MSAWIGVVNLFTLFIYDLPNDCLSFFIIVQNDKQGCYEKEKIILCANLREIKNLFSQRITKFFTIYSFLSTKYTICIVEIFFYLSGF